MERAEDKIRILVADEDAVIGNLITLWLEKYGFETDYARNEVVAFALLSIRKYRFIITGLSDNGLSGHELVRRIKEISPDSEILGMSGIWWLEDLFYRAGASRFLAKPFIFGTLKQLAEEVQSPALACPEPGRRG